MKSEERHQLLTNDLGVVTTKSVGFIEQHLGTIIGSVVALILVVGIASYLTTSSKSENAAGWTLLNSAQSEADLGTVVDKFKGKPPGQWAKLRVAEDNLKTGMPLLLKNREIALSDIKSARESFEELLQEKSVDTLIRERSLWGLALCLECTCEGDTSKAVEAFERLLSDFPETMFKSVAEERVATLKKTSSKEFYTWFSRENPKPPEPIRPDDKKPGGINLPAPSGGLDGFEDDDKPPVKKQVAPVPPDGEQPKAAESTTEKASEPTPPAGDSKPAADAKPEDAAKPADAEKKPAEADPAAKPKL